MSLSHVWTLSFKRNPESATADTDTITGSSEANVDETLAIGTNVQVNLAIDVSALKSLYIKASTACTIKTNSSGSPDDTLVLTAGQVISWHNLMSADNPLTVDVTKIYVTNAAQCALKIYALQDATP